MSENYFINVPFNKISAKNTIYNNFDYETQELMYVINEENEENNIPNIYNFVYEYIKSLDRKYRPIVFSPDYSISSSTCSAISERYIDKYSENNIVKFTTKMKIIYFTPISHVNKLEHISAIEFSKSLLLNLFNRTEISYTKHHFTFPSENVLIYGLNDTLITNEDIEMLKLLNVNYYTLFDIKKMDKEIYKKMDEFIGDSPIYIIYDMSVLSFEYSPCCFRFIANCEKKSKEIQGLSSKEITDVFKYLKKNNIVGLDITGFNLKNDTPDIAFKITSQSALLPLIHLLGMKEKKINIYNEQTKFIICKPLSHNFELKKNSILLHEKKQLFNHLKKTNKDIFETHSDSDNDNDNVNVNNNDNDNENENENVNETSETESSDDDIGWYIMRNVSVDIKDKLILQLMKEPNNMILYKIDGECMYISFTTIEEQSQKSYYRANDIKDKVLTPGEKINMAFNFL